MVTVHLIAAARPNFMKVAPLYHALKKTDWCHPLLVHTGQHYDANMSDTFLQDLGIGNPDFHLGVGSGSHAEQTGGVMMAYEKVCLQDRPDWVIVVGDVNSTMACAITAKKLCLNVAHLEAGLRSRDWSMPEEINRVVTDTLSDLLWTPSPDADDNLKHEGIPQSKIHRIGNIMIDSYEMLRKKIEDYHFDSLPVPKNFGLVTLHRPVNVDNPVSLKTLVNVLKEISVKIPLIFPIHPRTQSRLQSFALQQSIEEARGLILTQPLSYIPFMGLVRRARLVITDSGGIQEETTYLGIPCLTLRENTERPITVTQGTNQLATPENLVSLVERILAGNWRKGRPPELWDGHTAARAVQSLAQVIDG